MSAIERFASLLTPMYKLPLYKHENIVQSGNLVILKTYIFVAYGGSYNPSFKFVSIEPLFVFSFVEKSLLAGLPGKGWVIIVQSCQIVQTKPENNSKNCFSIHINVSSVVEFQRWWVLKSKKFAKTQNTN